MDSLNADIKEYNLQLGRGRIQKAYKGILAFMSGLRSRMEINHPEFNPTAIYPGYMDMTYFALVPPELKDLKLKIAIVYLHEQGRFEGWLAGINRKVQAETNARLTGRDLAGDMLSKVQPGVDSIVETILADQPDFDRPVDLMLQLETSVLDFTTRMTNLLE